MGSEFIAALDVGTTTVRCHIYSKSMDLVGSAYDKISILRPKPGYEEIIPEQLWLCVVETIKKAIKNAGLWVHQIKCLGISSQRCTFVTWDKISKKPFHNFISWKDLRANDIVCAWNDSPMFKLVKIICYCLYVVTRREAFLAASLLTFSNAQVLPRLFWVLRNDKKLAKCAAKGEAMFGTIDSWLLYRFGDYSTHCTDCSSASATGLFNPFSKNWASFLPIFRIPKKILPSIACTAADPCNNFPRTSQNVFGAEIPITCCMADQMASAFGSLCFEEGDIKITLGTGGFVDLNTGGHARANLAGLYPLLGWKISTEEMFFLEGGCHDIGTVIEWARSINLFDSFSELDKIGESADSEGVYFIPAFSGLQIPVNDSWAGAGFIGVRQTTTKKSMVKAILESIAFRMFELYSVILDGVDGNIIQTSFLWIDGGVCRNNFICQCLADLTQTSLKRSKCTELSARGVAYQAGLAAGIWDDKEMLKNFLEIDKIFKPSTEGTKLRKKTYARWMEAKKRFLGWNKRD